MYVHPRKDRNGQIYYSFTFIDKDDKRRRLAKTEHPHFTDKAAAEEWARTQAANLACRKAYHVRKLAWRSQYYDYTELLETYTTWQRDRAPNSWKSSLFYLEQWVFPYFLGQVQAGNVNDWHLHFRGFIDWLRSPTAVLRKRRTGPLAISTINNIVKTLNGFLAFLLAYNKIDPDNVRKCPAFPEYMVNHRDFDDVISSDEFALVHKQLATIHPPAADFFHVLWHTGMRFSELFGLPITSLFRGEINNKALHDELTKCGIDYVGYIYLDSQPATDDRKRLDDGYLPRKPLKSCKTIGPKSARIIPIRSRETWNILATRFKAQEAEFAARRWTGNKADYVFFQDLEWNFANSSLRRAYTELNMTPKGYHCCRHSFVTLLVGETRSFFLVRAITGHKKDKSFERYLHIYEQIALAAKQKEQTIDVI